MRKFSPNLPTTRLPAGGRNPRAIAILLGLLLSPLVFEASSSARRIGRV
ncbi:MAG: hypothetical protein WKF75_12030 [Singulisphaera sp.]